MIHFYLACLIISFGLFLFQIVFDKRKSINQYVMLIGVIIANGGYLALAKSENLAEALLATKMAYVGGCFLPMLYFFTLSELCHVKIKSLFRLIPYTLQTILFTLVCTIGDNDWYYRDAEFYTMDGIGYLSKEYGPLHILYPVTMYGYVALSAALAVYALYKKKSVHKKSISLLLVFFLLSTVSYGVEKVLNLQVEFIPLIYTLLIVGSMACVFQSNFFTVYENRDIIEKQLGRLGFITFDSKLRYMGCNETAELIFPEIRDYRIGYSIEKPGEQFQTSVLDALIKYSQRDERKKIRNSKTSTFVIGSHTYDCMIHPLYNYRKKCGGYTVEIKNETEHYNALEISNNYSKKLSHDVDEKTRQIREIQDKTIMGMAQMVESRDLSTGGHIKRTSEVVRIFSEKLLRADMGFTREYLNLVIRSAPMHDLGKIGVDDAILRKQARFTEEEYNMMKKHSEVGADIVKNVLTGVEDERFVEIAINVAHYHHEKVNGMGYPSGLKGSEIPVEARIMALADVFDALVSKRCYKESFSFDKAFEIIKTDSGTHFDPELAKIFLKCRPELEAFYSSDL